MEGGDDHIAIRTYAEEAIAEANKVIEAGEVEVLFEGKGLIKVKVINIGVADQAAQHANDGQGGCNMPHPCGFCKVHKTEICVVGKTWGKRTIEENAKLAHAVPGVCPGCRCTIVEEVKDAETERPIASIGSKPPKVPFRFQPNPHSVVHFNQKPGQTSILKIPLSNWCICVLHMNLRIVGMLFEYTVLRDPTLQKKIQGTKGDSQTLAEAVYMLLSAANIHIKHLRSPTNNVDSYYHSISRHNFAGSDASKLLHVWEPLLNLIYPECLRKENPQIARDHKASHDAWKQWATVVWPLIHDLDMDKKEKAAKVFSEGSKFVKLWKKVAGPTQHLYLHLLTAHLPEMIESMPVDPVLLQMQAAESMHALRKKLSFLTSKLAPKEVTERVSVIEDYWRLTPDGRVQEVKGYKRNDGPCRTYQTLVKSLLVGKLQHIYETEKSMALQLERADKRRMRRHR